MIDTEHNFGELTHDDLGKLHTLVKRRSNRLLTREDREDLVSQILEEATTLSRKSGLPVKVAMFVIARYPSYYVRFADRIMNELRNREISDIDAPEPFGAVDFTDSVAIRDMVSRLPLVEQIILIAHDLEYQTIVEIAADLDIPRSTVHRRLNEARTQMREYWLAA